MSDNNHTLFGIRHELEEITGIVYGLMGDAHKAWGRGATIQPYFVYCGFLVIHEMLNGLNDKLSKLINETGQGESKNGQ